MDTFYYFYFILFFISSCEYVGTWHLSFLCWWLHANVWVPSFLQSELRTMSHRLIFLSNKNVKNQFQGRLNLPWSSKTILIDFFQSLSLCASFWKRGLTPRQQSLKCELCVCMCVSASNTENKSDPPFSYRQPRREREAVAMAPWNEESLTRVPYIFKPLIGIASKVAPPAALPFSCCTATLVSGPGSLEEGCRSGPAGTREPNWGPRTAPFAATAVPPLADGRIKTLWLARGQRSPGGCSACRARGELRCDGGRIGQRRPAVCMNSDWSPQLLSLSLPLKGKRKDKWRWHVYEVWNPSLKCTLPSLLTHCFLLPSDFVSETVTIMFVPDLLKIDSPCLLAKKL